MYPDEEDVKTRLETNCNVEVLDIYQMPFKKWWKAIRPKVTKSIVNL